MSEKLCIMVVDDDRGMVSTFVDILTRKGYDAQGASSGPEALEMIKEGKFDCVLTDIRMPKMDGVALYREIATILPDLPVVLMSAYTANHQVDEVLEEGAVAVMDKPLNIERLLSFFSAISKKTSIVIVDDDPGFCKTMSDILRNKGFDVTMLSKSDDWENWSDNFRANGKIILLDIRLNGISGLDILQKIKKRYPDQPVIMITGYPDEMVSLKDEALKVSAYPCLRKPLQIEELIHTINEMKHKELGKMLVHY